MPVQALQADVDERYLKAGVWQTRVIYELVEAQAAREPAKDAVCDQTRRLTYEQLLDESNSLASFLLELGIDEGDCVAVQSGNTVELAVAHLACSRVGATFVPLSSAWRRTELRELLRVSEAPVLFVPRADGHDYVAEAQPLLDRIVRFEELLSILSRPAARIARPGDPDRPRYTMASSGTTNVPKLSLWTDNNLWAFSSAWCDAVALAPEDRMV